MGTVSNSGAICAGNNLSFTSLASGGTGTLTYSWLGPNSFVPTLQNPEIRSASVVASCLYTVKVTGENSCTATGVSTTNPTVNSIPPVGANTGSNVVCIGSTTTMANSTAGGTWTSGNSVASIGSASGVVKGIALGGSMITYTVTNIYGCVSAVSKHINVQGVPQYIKTYAGTGSTVSSGDGGPAVSVKLWSPCGVAFDKKGYL